MQTWIPFIPENASTLAWKVDALYFYLSGVTLFFTLLISAILVFFVIRYRRRTPYEIPRPIAGSHKLETLWTVIPFIIAMSMFAWGAQVYFENSRPPKNADRKSTRLNSSHLGISYAVFCLKKKKKNNI